MDPGHPVSFICKDLNLGLPRPTPAYHALHHSGSLTEYTSFTFTGSPEAVKHLFSKGQFHSYLKISTTLGFEETVCISWANFKTKKGGGGSKNAHEKEH